MKNIEWIEDAVKASNDYEETNSDLKRRYLLRNIRAFTYISSLVTVNRGSFGTGYPFTVLTSNFSGRLPVVQEQIRYNRELLNHATTTKTERWTCAECLRNKYHDMPDLKTVCKPCPNVDKELKPRKVINRLPDIDMWMICKDGHLEEAQEQLTKLLEQYEIHTSDVDPLQTIKDITEIVQNIKDGVMPKKFLPMDAHIMEYSKMQKLISMVPTILQEARKNKTIPYLPIHPKSYRKTWQYDDEAYNFIYDFLSAFKPFDLPPELEKQIQTTRRTIANEFSPAELYRFLIQSATEANKRRFQEPELIHNFFKRVEEWSEEPEQTKKGDR